MKLIGITDRPRLDDASCFGYHELKITCDDELADEIVSFVTKLQNKAMDKICREYLSKSECCDECCAEFYCIENHLRSSRVPQDYCVDNLKAYLKAISKEESIT